jgi:hypothetical protein
MNELQKANELKEKWNSPYLKPDEYSSVLTEAKTNLDGLVCDCGNSSMCYNCLELQKAKEIYEGILK